MEVVVAEVEVSSFSLFFRLFVVSTWAVLSFWAEVVSPVVVLLLQETQKAPNKSAVVVKIMCFSYLFSSILSYL